MSSRRRSRSILTALLAIVPVVPIVAGVALGSGQAGRATPARAATFTPAAGPTATPTLSPAPAQARGAATGALVAHLIQATDLRLAVGGRVLGRLRTHTEFGSPTFLWVVASQPGWLGVLSTLAGNGRIGWIPQSAAALSRVSWEVRVSLRAHMLTVTEGGAVRRRYPVAIGRPSAPTPTGRFAVTDRLLTGNPVGPYGCCILALTAVSPHPIEAWSGGNRVAVHSTPDPSSIGQSVSHGCVRVAPANGRWLLDHVPLGTPVLISA